MSVAPAAPSPAARPPFALSASGAPAQEARRPAAARARAGPACVAVLVRDGKRDQVAPLLPPGARAVGSVEELLAAGPDLVADCAGHEALRLYAEPLLRAGASLVTVSSGALAAPALEARLAAAQARPGGGRLLIASGAMLGLDGLAAARYGGLERVRYRGIKPARAWRGTPAEALLDLDGRAEPAEFFRGSAREAASQYPANANVTATIALAGIGFDRTEVCLVADPAGRENIHQLEYAGAFGRAQVEVRGRPSPANPKTSLLTGLSVWRALCEETLASLPLMAPRTLVQ